MPHHVWGRVQPRFHLTMQNTAQRKTPGLVKDRINPPPPVACIISRQMIDTGLTDTLPTARVRENYLQSFRELQETQRPHDSDSVEAFTATVDRVHQRDSDTVLLMACGLQDLMRDQRGIGGQVRGGGEEKEELERVQDFLDHFYQVGFRCLRSYCLCRGHFGFSGVSMFLGFWVFGEQTKMLLSRMLWNDKSGTRRSRRGGPQLRKLWTPAVVCCLWLYHGQFLGPSISLLSRPHPALLSSVFCSAQVVVWNCEVGFGGTVPCFFLSACSEGMPFTWWLSPFHWCRA